MCVHVRVEFDFPPTDSPIRTSLPHHSGLKGMSEAEADAQLSKFIIVFKYLQVSHWVKWTHVDGYRARTKERRSAP